VLTPPRSDEFVSDDWLTSVLGVPSFRWDVVELEEDSDPVIPAGFVSVKLNSAGTAAIRTIELLQRRGFRLVNVEISFEGTVGGKTDSAMPGLHPAIRPAVSSDAPSVQRIASESFRTDRFHRDHFIPKPVADRLKGEWATNFFLGRRGTHMYVWDDGTIRGFLLLILERSRLIIDLVATDSHSRGRGIARRLIEHSVAELSQNSLRLRVGTQIDNAASIRLYSSLGLSLVDSRLVLHRTPVTP
jgi:ribosomal protein S18 acetylase RimI-like enzyme